MQLQGRKSVDGALSLADCFALALTRRVGGVLLSTDSELAKSEEIRVKYFEVK